MSDENMWDSYHESDFVSGEESGMYEELPEIPEENYEEEDYDLDFIDEEYEAKQEESVMEHARIRLEQGKLYEMLIKHDLFDGVDAMPEAVEKVEREIKEFIVERLEILLGMRAEKEKQSVSYQSQFDDNEVDALRNIAQRLIEKSGPVAPKPKSVNTEPSPINRVKKKVLKPKINALGKEAPKAPVRQKTKAKTKSSKPLPTRSSNKPKRKLKDEYQKNTDNMSVFQAAKKDLEYLEKLESMSLEDKNKIVAERHNRPRPPLKDAHESQQTANRVYEQRHLQGQAFSDKVKLGTIVANLKNQGKI